MKTKRFFSVLLVIMMAVSYFAISANASESTTRQATGDLTIHLFEGENKIDTNDIETGTEVSDYGVGKTAINDVIFTVTRVADDADPEAAASAAALLDDENEVVYSADTTKTVNGVTKVTGLIAGRYKVEVKSKPVNVGDIATFLVDVPITTAGGDKFEDNVHVYPKTSVTVAAPKVDKKVAAVPSEGAVSSYSDYANLIDGQAAEWQITSSIPNSFALYSKYTLTDTISDSLSYQENTLSVVGKTSGDEVELTSLASISGNTITVTIADPHAFATSADTKDITELVITYQTKIADYETKAGELIPNHVSLVYNKYQTGVLIDNPDFDPTEPESETNKPKVPNDPTNDKHNEETNNWKDPEKYNDGIDDEENGNPEGTTPGEDYDPWVWTGKIVINKVDALDTDKGLEGVEFTLTSTAALPSGITSPVKTGSNGVITLSGLLDGTYTLTESKTIAGYELNNTPITIVVENGKVKSAASDYSGFVTKSDDFTAVIKNIPSTHLPLTGGMGVAFFAIAGLTLVAFGSTYLFKLRKVKIN